MNRPPLTKEEEAYQKKVRDLGCIVCFLFEHEHSEVDIHHTTGKWDKDTEFNVLGLCPTHHRRGVNNKFAVGYHESPGGFVKRYGTVTDLREATRKLLDEI